MLQLLLLVAVAGVDGGQLAASVALSAEVHQGFDGLLALESARLHLVHGRVQDLTVHAGELAELLEVDLNILRLREELADEVEHVQERAVEGSLLHVGVLGHDAEVWLRGGLEHDSSVLLEVRHARLIDESMFVKEGVVEVDVDDPGVLVQGLEADDGEVLDVHGALHLDLALAESNPRIKKNQLENQKKKIFSRWAPSPPGRGLGPVIHSSYTQRPVDPRQDTRMSLLVESRSSSRRRRAGRG